MTDWTSAIHGDGAYADVNGINLYYETFGSGRPLILLHGGLGSGEMFGPIIPRLANIVGSPLLAEAALAFLDAPGA